MVGFTYSTPAFTNSRHGMEPARYRGHAGHLKKCLSPVTDQRTPEKGPIRLAHGFNIRKTSLQALGISLSVLHIHFSAGVAIPPISPGTKIICILSYSIHRVPIVCDIAET